MKKFILPLLLSGMLLIPVKGQKEEMSSPLLKHEIGMAAGWSTGYGISYRYWPGRIGIQMTTTPYFEKNYSAASFGITGLMTLSEIQWMRVFLYLGNHYLYYRSMDYYGYDQFGNPVELSEPVNKSSGRYILGIGPGFELMLGKKFGFNIMFGFRSDWSPDDYRISVTGETGIYYRF
ncbi:MAG: hypothetical protein JXA39_05960 [Bacteroidales bacterium]|nr:hypothetical protein [Bacteroidales bacterium]